MGQKKLLNEYEAAAAVGISPTLLRWFTKHAPKRDDPRKLKIAKESKDTIFFEENELRSFNEWLRLPWPHKKGDRPRIPKGIRVEVRVEANGACAICNAHADTCEAAHLDPVSKSKCNHPENLLWLCANHHTAYDDDLFGPDQENAEFVTSFKVALHRHKKMLWRMQDEVSRKLFLVLDDCDRLADQLVLAKTPTQINAVKRMATEALDRLPDLAPVSREDPHYDAYKTISPRLASLKTSPKRPEITARLEEAQSIKRDFVAALGYVGCPLCDASGTYDGSDCPVCGGDREIEEETVRQIDLAIYERVECPLCDGNGTFDGDDCPECGGQGEMPRYAADQVEVRQYESVKCPLCGGKGKFHGDDCPECRGDGEMPRHAAEQVDARQYEDVKCPLCRGTGKRAGDDCPECRGEGELPRHAADQVDVRQYESVECPLCGGKGQYAGEDCPECGGEGEMPRHAADQVDLRQYEMVRCPLCKRKKDECRFCGGEGEVTRGAADNFDAREYS
jgi:DnaJ-class molecular chaperone